MAWCLKRTLYLGPGFLVDYQHLLLYLHLGMESLVLLSLHSCQHLFFSFLSLCPFGFLQTSLPSLLAPESRLFSYEFHSLDSRLPDFSQLSSEACFSRCQCGFPLHCPLTQEFEMQENFPEHEKCLSSWCSLC